MKKPTFSVRKREGMFGSSHPYAVDEYYDDERTATCTAGHPTRIAAEASAAALQGAIERFIERSAYRCSLCGHKFIWLSENEESGVSYCPHCGQVDTV